MLLIVLWFASVIVTGREWAEMLHQWWNIETYNHITLIPFIIGWLVWIRRDELAKVEPHAWWPGVFLAALASALWVTGKVTGINLFAHAGAVGITQSIVVAVLGLRASAILLLPLGFAVFLVPFGDEIIPQLQYITAKITIALTRLSGVPATIDGTYISTPVGLFIVAEACSGVKFLVAMVALGVLVCFTAFDSWTKRALFVLASIIVPIIANGIRAWGTVFVAQSQGIEFAEGFDHIVYGWIFFAIVIAILIGGSFRYFEREPEDAGFTAKELNGIATVQRWESYSASALLIGFLVLGVLITSALAVSTISS